MLKLVRNFHLSTIFRVFGLVNVFLIFLKRIWFLFQTVCVGSLCMPNILDPNGRFLELFHPYIVNDWRHYYFAYDKVKNVYTELKHHRKKSNGHTSAVETFDNCFYEEIEKVDDFTAYLLFQVEQDLKDVEHYAHRSDLAEEDKMALERILQDNFAMLKEIQHYHKLNIFVICKAAKKLAKLRKEKTGEEDFQFWRTYPSFTMFNERFCARRKRIKQFRAQIIDMYGVLFRRTYKVLTVGELKYVKDRTHEMQRSHTWLGVKIGIIITVLVWLFFIAFNWQDDTFFQNPALFVYTTIGNILLFRLSWGINVFLWTKYGVNYISLLNLNVFKPNINQLAEQTTTHFLMFMINFLVFTLSNQRGAGTGGFNAEWLQVLCPLALIAAMLLLFVFEFVNQHHLSQSNGSLFDFEVYFRLLTAPLKSVRFRDVFTADILTSFTKIISDGVYATCWILSGAVAHPNQTTASFGSKEMTCKGRDIAIIAAVAVMFPLWIRFLQCFRVLIDTGMVYPHFYNMLKYLSSIAVVLYSTFRGVDVYFYIFFLLPSTLYKSWWDVVMDWGFFNAHCTPPTEEVKKWVRRGGWMPELIAWVDQGFGRVVGRLQNTSVGKKYLPLSKKQQLSESSASPTSPYSPNSPNSPRNDDATAAAAATANAHVKAASPTKHWYLRESLMYPHMWLYYVYIIVDLILRFLWVSSLMANSDGGTSASFLNSPQMKFFFGSLEIIRRSMWSHVRMEYEHVKFINKKALGFSMQLRRKHFREMVSQNGDCTNPIHESFDAQKESSESPKSIPSGGTVRPTPTASPEATAAAAIAALEEGESVVEMTPVRRQTSNTTLSPPTYNPLGQFLEGNDSETKKIRLETPTLSRNNSFSTLSFLPERPRRITLTSLVPPPELEDDQIELDDLAFSQFIQSHKDPFSEPSQDNDYYVEADPVVHRPRSRLGMNGIGRSPTNLSPTESDPTTPSSARPLAAGLEGFDRLDNRPNGFLSNNDVLPGNVSSEEEGVVLAGTRACCIFDDIDEGNDKDFSIL